MPTKIEPPATGNWLNWDLYSKAPVKDKDLTSFLENIRAQLKKYISGNGNKDFLYILHLKLFADKRNSGFYRLKADLNVIPKRTIPVKEFDFENASATSGSGLFSLAIVPPSPVPPKGQINITPFIPVLHDIRLSREMGSMF